MIALVEGVFQWFYDFLFSNGVPDTMSPETIVLVNQKTDLNQKIITFGAHEMVYISTKNTMRRRSVPVIILNESNKRNN